MKAIVLAAVIAIVSVLVTTRMQIAWMVKRGHGQFVRDDGPTTHHVKRGTPTAGGISMIFSVVLAYTVTHLVLWTPPSASGLLVLFLLVGLGIVGFLDDVSKIRKERSLGLSPRGKIIGQIIVGGIFSVLALILPDVRGVRPASSHISFLRDIPWLDLGLDAAPWLGLGLVSLWLIFLITGFSNAVNVTSGLDGLAPGALTMAFSAYALINIWQVNQWCGRSSTEGPRCYEVRNPWDLAIVSIALAAVCFGFLWWNANPAKIFDGDTGSLALGGALAGLAICTRTELLLVILGGLFVVETLSVMLQVGYFKLTHGKRIFKMSPLHHHFEQLGWKEVTVVIRFWIIAGLCSATALGLFYAEWVLGQ
ncbi:MAG: phospho-N-acetylmuramoyl-pentapeptide-transferase [Propionibacteriaceae bacterium]